VRHHDLHDCIPYQSEKTVHMSMKGILIDPIYVHVQDNGIYLCHILVYSQNSFRVHQLLLTSKITLNRRRIFFIY